MGLTVEIELRLQIHLPASKSVFKELRFRDGLEWPSRRNRAAFSISSALKSVFIKLRFRDRLVWTVGHYVEMKLRFRDGLVWTVSLTVEIKLLLSNSKA